MIERFLYWVRERHNIYLRRERGEPRPWTDDEVLQTWFFTNPYRENDKTTVWFREHVREPLRNDPRVLMATLIFRRFNYIPTGELLLEYLTEWNADSVLAILKRQPKVFTGAFKISSPHCEPKLPAIVRLIDKQWRRRDELLQEVEAATTLRDAWMALQSEHHKGFMSYEVVSDLRWTYLLEDATDILTWCHVGPGARRGLNRLGLHDSSLPELLRICRQEFPDFEMRDVEHSLCEYHKYETASHGDGRMKRRAPKSRV